MTIVADAVPAADNQAHTIATEITPPILSLVISASLFISTTPDGLQGLRRGPIPLIRSARPAQVRRTCDDSPSVAQRVRPTGSSRVRAPISPRPQLYGREQRF